jgi:hypothetical protein
MGEVGEVGRMRRGCGGGNKEESNGIEGDFDAMDKDYWFKAGQRRLDTDIGWMDRSTRIIKLWGFNGWSL